MAVICKLILIAQLFMCVFDVAIDHSNHLFTLWTVFYMVTMFTMRYGWCLAMSDPLDAPLKNNLTSM